MYNLRPYQTILVCPEEVLGGPRLKIPKTWANIGDYGQKGRSDQKFALKITGDSKQNLFPETFLGVLRGSQGSQTEISQYMGKYQKLETEVVR